MSFLGLLDRRNPRIIAMLGFDLAKVAGPHFLGALAAFISLGIVLTLSTLLHKRTAEMFRRKEEVSRLHRLSKALTESTLDSSSIARCVTDSFELEYCRIYLPDPPIPLDTLLEEYECGVRFVILKVGERTIGILALKPGSVPWQTLDTAANMVGLALQRVLLLEELRIGFADR